MLATLCLTSAAAAARAEILPAGPLTLADGRVTLGADVSLTTSCARATDGHAVCGDDTGFFNYTDYARSLLRLARVDVTGAVTASRHVAVLGEVRSENGDRPRVYGLYARIRPWADRNVDLQAGRIPTVFGAFPRRAYASDNVLIGYPLAYQYLTSLRPDALPADADELLRMRGRGWLSNFTVGNTAPAAGVPLVNVLQWDTGVQAHAATERLDVSAAVTIGTLANPLVRDDNHGAQVSGRLAIRPRTGLVAGVSASRGPFLATSTRLAARAPMSAPSDQTAWGGDAEYSAGHALLRAEAVMTTWRVPVQTSQGPTLSLSATGVFVEARYRFHPRFQAATRLDRLTFGTIQGQTRRDTWDAPVTRLEIGGDYALQRNARVRLSFQHNRRGGGRVTGIDALAMQFAYWF